MNYLELLKANQLHYSWNTIYVGIKLGVLNFNDLAKYAEEYLLQNPSCNDPYIADLFFVAAKQVRMDELFDSLFISLNLRKPKEDGTIWNLEKRKLVYVALKYWRTEISDDYELLTKVKQVCEDFYYPESLRDFVYQTDSKEYENLSTEQYFALRRKKLNILLNSEKLKLEAKESTIAILEAFKAMQSFLDAYYLKTSSNDVGSLLSDLILLKENKTADSTACEDWQDSIEKVLNKKIDMQDQNLHITILEAYKAMRNFLYAYHLRISSDDVGNILNSLLLLKDNKPANPESWHDWIDAAAKALSEKEN